MSLFSIKELADFSGIKAHTIRTWEQRFNFLQPARTAKLRRAYSLEELCFFLNISLLNRHGYKVSRIAGMDAATLQNTLQSLTDASHRQHKAINALITCMAAMDTDGFDAVLEDAMLSWGVEETITSVLLPFMQKVGMHEKLMTKTARPALLLVEQPIKQKLILGIERLTPKHDAETALLFVADKRQEVTLLQCCYALKKAGYKIILITNEGVLPVLQTIVQKKEPSYVITALPQKSSHFDAAGLTSFIAEAGLPTQFVDINNFTPGATKPQAIISSLLKRETAEAEEF